MYSSIGSKACHPVQPWSTIKRALKGSYPTQGPTGTCSNLPPRRTHVLKNSSWSTLSGARSNYSLTTLLSPQCIVNWSIRCRSSPLIADTLAASGSELSDEAVRSSDEAIKSLLSGRTSPDAPSPETNYRRSFKEVEDRSFETMSKHADEPYHRLKFRNKLTTKMR